MRISDWSSDVCSSDLIALRLIESRADAEPRLADIAAVTAQPQQHAASDLGAVIEAQARAPPGDVGQRKIGRAACRERVCQYVVISLVAGCIKKQNNNDKRTYTL